jgi:hypothetical protein
MELSSLGKWLIAAGMILALIGLGVLVAPRMPWLGRLPGDIYIKKENFTFYFPLATCLVVSLVISLLVRLFKK